MLILYSSECSSLREIEANINLMVQLKERLDSTPSSSSERRVISNGVVEGDTINFI